MNGFYSFWWEKSKLSGIIISRGAWKRQEIFMNFKNLNLEKEGGDKNDFNWSGEEKN